MSTQKSEKKEPDVFSGRLIDLLGEVDLSYLTEEIPEMDLKRISAERIRETNSEQMAAESIREPDWMSTKRIYEANSERIDAKRIQEADWNKMSAGNDPAANSEKPDIGKIRKLEPDGEKRVRRPQRIGWKRVAVFSGVAAAGSAAVTGVIVFACMRHSFGSAGTK